MVSDAEFLLLLDVDVSADPLLLDSVIADTVAAYSVRKLSTAYEGECLRLRRSSDNAESDFGFDDNGDLDVDAITTWLGGANGFIHTWYDQSGNARNMAQSTTANQLQYIASGQNSKPVLRADGTNDRLFASSIPNFANGNYTLNIIRKSSGTGFALNFGSTSNSTPLIGLFHISTGNARFDHRDDAGVRVDSGSFEIAAANGDFHIHTGRRNGTTFYQRVDNASDTRTASLTTTTLAELNLAARNAGGAIVTFLAGDIAEMIAFNTAISDSALDDIYTNQNAYWQVFF